MKETVLGLMIIVMSSVWSFAQEPTTEQVILDLSKEKWQWMLDNTDIHEATVNVIGTTAILLCRITLLAVVGGNEVTNPFTVTEVYLKQDEGNWKLASMSFTRLLTPPGR